MKSLYKSMPPNLLFISSIVCFPAVLLQQNTLFLWFDVFLFLILLTMKNGRVKIVPSFFIFISIVFFNLLTPSGKVYVYVGEFPLTQGALLFGIQKAGILLSMVFISQYAITRELALPGKIGFFINSMFYFFEHLTDHKTSFDVKKPFKSIDSILLEVYTKDTSSHTIVYERKIATIPCMILCAIPILITYTLLLLTYL